MKQNSPDTSHKPYGPLRWGNVIVMYLRINWCEPRTAATATLKIAMKSKPIHLHSRTQQQKTTTTNCTYNNRYAMNVQWESLLDISARVSFYFLLGQHWNSIGTLSLLLDTVTRGTVIKFIVGAVLEVQTLCWLVLSPLRRISTVAIIRYLWQ